MNRTASPGAVPENKEASVVSSQEQDENFTSDHSDASPSKEDDNQVEAPRREMRTTSQRRSRKPKPAKAGYRYRKLLNTTIEHAAQNHSDEEEVLPSSQIGASYWTSQEKSRFFRKLSSVGPGELHQLAKAVQTKSRPEIQAYILLLRKGVAETADAHAAENDFSLSHVPAAFEVEGDVDDAIDRARTVLNSRLREKQNFAEQARHGKTWLITEALADEIEAEIATLAGEEASDTAKDDEPADGDQHSDGYKDQTTAGAQQEDEGLEEPPEKVSAPSPSSAKLAVPSSSLLRPSTFLELSRSCFMGPDPGYAQLENESLNFAPSIYRTAFDDFHNLTISLTRRLVQTTIFQAMTRLRGKESSSPIPQVRPCDVGAATDILGMRSDRKAYWSNLPRRCGVDVYTEAAKYADGRTSTKQGFKLTLAEAEAELGLPNDKANEMELEEEDENSDHELHAYHNDSDAWTEEASSGSQTPSQNSEAATPNSATAPQNEEPSKQAPTMSRKRNRTLSPDGHAKAEDAYLEALDQQASKEENNRLRELLRMPSRDDGARGSPLPEASPPRISADRPEQGVEPTGSWRETVEFEAPWEQVTGVPPLSAFARMEKVGRRRRKRRKLAERQLRGGDKDVDGIQDQEGDVDDQDDDADVMGEEDVERYESG
ncbi:hypothetical protein MBLNU230_g5143t1 [Neophaeotheca triangularis]